MNKTNKIGDWSIVPIDEQAQVIQCADDVLRVLQKLDVSISARKKSNILIVQNVQMGNHSKLNTFGGISLEELLRELLSSGMNLVAFKKFMGGLYIKTALDEYNGSRAKTAEALGVRDTYLSRLITEYGIRETMVIEREVLPVKTRAIE